MMRSILFRGKCMAIRAVEAAQDCDHDEQANDDHCAYGPHEQAQRSSVTTPGLLDH
jgi:hypothetical protein